MVFSVDQIVSHVSYYIARRLGDVIFTGTPGTTQTINPGDVVEIEVERVSVLRNRVVVAEAKN